MGRNSVHEAFPFVHAHARGVTYLCVHIPSFIIECYIVHTWNVLYPCAKLAQYITYSCVAVLSQSLPPLLWSNFVVLA